MRRQGLGPAAIGAFVGSLYLPWAFKWAVGPFVDTFSSDRFGRRRTWIFLMQLGMSGTLLLAMGVDFVSQIGLFTAIIFLHNAFGATQDVAIDALAVSVASRARARQRQRLHVRRRIDRPDDRRLGRPLPDRGDAVRNDLPVRGRRDPGDHGLRRLPLREKVAPLVEGQVRVARNVGVELKRFVARHGNRSPARARRWSASSPRCCRPARTRSASRCNRISRSSSAWTTTRSRSSISSAP